MYNSKFCLRIKDHCRDGHSILSFLDVLDAEYQVSISFDTLIEWANDPNNIDFRLALDIAQSAEVMYWEGKAASAMKNSDSQTLQMAKFMLDQKAELYVKIYKKVFGTSLLKDMTKRRITMDSSDPDRDILDDLKDG